MKKLSIALLALTTVQAAMSATGDVTAVMVAFVLFCNTCGWDVVKMWNKLIPDNNETDR